MCGIETNTELFPYLKWFKLTFYPTIIQACGWVCYYGLASL